MSLQLIYIYIKGLSKNIFNHIYYCTLLNTILTVLLKSAYFFNFTFSKLSVNNTCNPYERLSQNTECSKQTPYSLRNTI